MIRAWRLNLTVGLVGFTGLAYEVGLTRIFSLGQWHHFTHMIVSMAMLGFAAAGTILAVLEKEAARRSRLLIPLMAGLLLVSLPLCYGLSQQIPFETLELTTQPVQSLYLLVLYLVLSVPFFVASCVVTLTFMIRTKRVGQLYFSDLAGSALGALGTILSLYVIPPHLLPYLLMLPAAGALLVSLPPFSGQFTVLLGAVCAIVLALLVLGPTRVRMSQYKPLSLITSTPQARTVARTFSPLSVVDAVASPQLRESPGQIAGYPFSEKGPLPRQIGLYTDGNGPTVVNRADSPADLSRFAYLDYVTSALPYRVRTPDRVAVLGSGGGTGVWNALYHGADTVAAVEVDPGVMAMMRTPLREFSGQLYFRSDVRPVLNDARGHLRSHKQTYDLIQLSPTDSLALAGGGIHALSETYLLTRESFTLFVDRLNPNGMLAVTRWLKTPPRDSLKVLATLIEAARRSGLRPPAEHLAAIRSWNTLTVVLSKQPLGETSVDRLTQFARSRGFDRVYYPGMSVEEANQHTQLRTPLFHRATRRLLEDPETFYERYVFRVRPATDDRPYFYRFFRWSSLNYVLERLGTRWTHVVEWGYLALVLTLVQVLPVALVLLLIPVWLANNLNLPAGSLIVMSLYFVCLGLGFMFLEIAYIQRFMRYLAYPVYAVGVVLAGFLVASGFGSYLTDQLRDVGSLTRYGTALGVLALTVLVYRVSLDTLFSLTAGWSDPARIVLTLALLVPLAGPLGVFFPTGLLVVSDRESRFVPLAWAANGASSVLGAILGMVLAMHLGFGRVIYLAVGLYLVAGLVLTRIRSPE